MAAGRERLAKEVTICEGTGLSLSLSALRGRSSVGEAVNTSLVMVELLVLICQGATDPASFDAVSTRGLMTESCRFCVSCGVWSKDTSEAEPFEEMELNRICAGDSESIACGLNDAEAAR